jgi:type IV secretion system protein VirB2
MKPKSKIWLSTLGTVVGYGALIATPTYAMQISQLTSGLSWIQTTLTGIGAVLIIIAIMWCGFKMIWQHAKWSEVAHIFFGGILIGGAAAIGPQLFGGGSGS